MSKKYNCKLCNYHTDNLYDFNKHKTTKKHIESTNNYSSSRNENKKRTCLCCEKRITYKNFSRHIKKCRISSKYDTIHQLLNTSKKQMELLNEQQSKLDQNKNLLKENTKQINELTKNIKEKDEIIYNLVTKLNNITDKYNKLTNNKTKKKRVRKQKIPATVRNTIWKLHMDNKTESKCYCCKVEPITKGNFECGHIVSEKDGGNIILDNLRPICGLCNKSMGTTNMLEFMKKYGYDTGVVGDII